MNFLICLAIAAVGGETFALIGWELSIALHRITSFRYMSRRYRDTQFSVEDTCRSGAETHLNWPSVNVSNYEQHPKSKTND